MKNFLSILLTMFVGMSVVGCYKNTSIATQCGKHYTIFVPKEKTDVSLHIEKFLLEEGYKEDRGYYYKYQISSGNEMSRQIDKDLIITVGEWVESGKKLKFDIYVTFGEYKCVINGFNENYKYFDDLVERIVLKLEE